MIITEKLSVERKKLNYLYNEFGKYEQDSKISSEVKSHLATYLCIRSNGHIEKSIRIIYGQYTKKRSHPNVANYVDNNLRYFQNAKHKKILDLTYNFSSEWGHSLEEYMSDEMKDSIDSIVAIKNSLAHGDNAGITYARLKQYWTNAEKVLDFIEDQCNK